MWDSLYWIPRLGRPTGQPETEETSLPAEEGHVPGGAEPRLTLYRQLALKKKKKGKARSQWPMTVTFFQAQSLFLSERGQIG